MSKRYQEYVGYEFIGGSQDGQMVTNEEACEEFYEGGMVQIDGELYIVRGKKLLFQGYNLA